MPYRLIAFAPSKSRPANEPHHVQYNISSDSFACTCEHWQFRHKHLGNRCCSHIKGAIAFQLFGTNWWKREDLPPIMLPTEEQMEGEV